MDATLHTRVNKREPRLQEAFSHHPFGEAVVLVIAKLHIDTVLLYVICSSCDGVSDVASQRGMFEAS
jgi:hypothetical protein